ncbi:MAG: hypothetical protein QNI90_06350 [Dinoroseobacter sp.]|nr:hypothetical protein [Dinoroseobacter sp.]
MTNVPDNSEPASAATFWPFWLAVAVTVLFCAYGILTGTSAYDFVQESGVIENASVVIFLCGALGFAVLRPDLAFGRGWHVFVIFLLFAARELDFDKRFTEKGVLQARLYSGDYPLEHKLIGAFFILLILYTLYRLVRYGWRPVMTGLWRGELWAWSVIAAGITVFVAKSLDGAGRKLAPFGIELTEETEFALSVIEEFGELGFGLLLVYALCAWMRSDAATRRDNSGYPRASSET